LKQSALFFRGCFIILGDMLHQVVARMHIHWKKCCFASCRSQFQWAGPPTSSPSSVAWYIPSGTLRTLAGSCGEDIAGVVVGVAAYLGLRRRSRMVSSVVSACGTLRIVACVAVFCGARRLSGWSVGFGPSHPQNCCGVHGILRGEGVVEETCFFSGLSVLRR